MKHTASIILESARSLLPSALVESVSYDYKVPSDPEKQIYDLYLLLTFKQIMDNKELLQPGLLRAGWDESTLADLKSIVDDGLKELTYTMRKDYLKACLVAISSELRHVFDLGKNLLTSDTNNKIQEALSKSQYDDLKKFMKINDLYQSSKRQTWPDVGSAPQYSAAYKAFQDSGMSANRLLEMGKKLFSIDIWNEDFGGSDWVNIVDATRLLLDAKDTDQIALALDRVIDMEHNTGFMIDKSSAFKKNGSYNWIKKTLDYKKKALPWKIASRSSLPSQLVGMLFRLTNVGTTKQSEEEQEQKLKRQNWRSMDSFTDIRDKNVVVVDRDGNYLTHYTNVEIQNTLYPDEEIDDITNQLTDDGLALIEFDTYRDEIIAFLPKHPTKDMLDSMEKIIAIQYIRQKSISIIHHDKIYQKQNVSNVINAASAFRDMVSNKKINNNTWLALSQSPRSPMKYAPVIAVDLHGRFAMFHNYLELPTTKGTNVAVTALIAGTIHITVYQKMSKVQIKQLARAANLQYQKTTHADPMLYMIYMSKKPKITLLKADKTSDIESIIGNVQGPCDS